MALPASGVIKASMIRAELKETGTWRITSPSSRKLAGKLSGTIKLTDFYGKSNLVWIKVGREEMEKGGAYQGTPEPIILTLLSEAKQLLRSKYGLVFSNIELGEGEYYSDDKSGKIVVIKSDYVNVGGQLHWMVYYIFDVYKFTSPASVSNISNNLYYKLLALTKSIFRKMEVIL